MNRRIIFVSEAFAFPSGGVAVTYKHAEILAAHGYSAMVALPVKPPVDFYRSSAPLLVHGGALNPQTGDVWVIPEGFQNYVEVLKGSPVTRLMLCQNQFYLPFGPNPRAGFAEFGVDGVIATSESIRKFFQDIYGLVDVPLIPCAVDTAVFKPAPTKALQIAFMPRKLADEAAFVQAMLWRLHPRHVQVPWVPIQGLSQGEAAARMGQSAVFLSLSHRDSFGLPPLEAMASGCLVAGFHGDGGREYMRPENGWWAETGDWRACVDGLAAALDAAQGNPSKVEPLRAAMGETVARYSPERQAAALLGFWSKQLQAST
jgi:glycosyltransferase involved in cell wall biosynthesis